MGFEVYKLPAGLSPKTPKVNRNGMKSDRGDSARQQNVTKVYRYGI